MTSRHIIYIFIKLMEDEGEDIEYEVEVSMKREEDECKLLYNEGRWNDFLKENVCDIAAYFGWIDLLEWARNNCCGWNEKTFSEAVRGGHLEMIEYLKKNGCPMNASACVYASDLPNNLEILKLLRNGPSDPEPCPWDEDLCYCARFRPEIITWLNENNCPCNRKYH